MNYLSRFFLLFASLALVSSESCEDRCGAEDTSQSCQCNTFCSEYSDCCDDYTSVCFSCNGRCNEVYDFSSPCHCNDECSDHGNCCSDYDTLCDASGGDLATEILAVTERIFELDESVLEYIVLDLDASGNPLFVSVDPLAFSSRTFRAFLALRDNYEPDVCAVETSDAEETAEFVEFLDAVFATAVMQETETFLLDNGLVEGQTVREAVEESFFTFYSRCGSNLGSDGFEHIFMGEIDSGVSGYHNWVSFYQDEQAGTLTFTENLGYSDIATKMSGLEMGFIWSGNDKPISSMYIGTTPEFELAIYSIAFFADRNAQVDVSLNGYSHQMQTWDISGTNYVASAYPLLTIF